ncbi:MAG: gliding motility-associated C-terminal domain-containing protein [Mucilaginibacter sp.]
MLFFAPLSGICQVAAPDWVNGIGGPNSDCSSSAVKTDGQNNVYVTGRYTQTVDFDPSPGVYNLTANAGSTDVYVAKYSTTGNLIWAVSIGGNSNDIPNSLTVDKEGNPIISGQYNSPDFDADPGSGSNILSSMGGFDAFVIKLNTNGSFMWAKSIGGVGNDYGGRVSVDSQGNMVSTIRFQSTVNVDGSVFTSQGNTNGLAIKYSPLGNLIWAIDLSDTADCLVGYGDFDHEDNFVMCGTFTGSVNFNPLGPASLLDGNGNASFVAKYTPNGLLIWVKPIYGDVLNDNNNLCINSKNDIFLTGPFAAPLTFDSTTIQSSSIALYLAKYSSAGEFKDVKVIRGNSSTIFNYGIVSSSDDKIYLSGYFTGTIDFNPSSQTNNTTFHGKTDFFLAKYDENLNYKLAFGGGSTDCFVNVGRNVAIDNNNDVIFTGSFCSTVNFSPSDCRTRLLTAQGVSDTYLAKYPQNEASRQGAITALSIPQQLKTPAIDQQNLKITVTVPAGANITALVPKISHTLNLALSPGSGIAQNFTSPVIYTLSVPCYSLNYVVEVVYSDVVTEKQLTICNGITSNLIGDIPATVPDTYAWQVLSNNSWGNAPGTFNEEDYQTSTLNNQTTSNRIVNFRRKLTKAGVSYDSFYGITVLPAISNNTIATPGNELICGSKNIDIIQGTTPSGGNGQYTYQWQSSPDGDDLSFSNIDGAVSQSYDPPVMSDTVFYRRLITTCGQLLSSNTIHYYIQPPPLAPVAQNDTLCAGETAALIVSTLPGIAVNWYANATGGNSIFTGDIFITPPVNTNLTVYAEAESEGGCVSARTPVSAILARPLPAPVVTMGEITLNSIVFNWSAVTTATGYEVSINGGEFIGVGNVLTYTAGSLTTGQAVALRVRATGVLSCELGNISATVTGTALTPAINQIFVANMFSPNGDGNNDILHVKSQGIQSLVFQIYSQWGEMVFRSVNKETGWDGSYKGNMVPVGVYMYYVEAVMLDGSKVNKKGSVTLAQ